MDLEGILAPAAIKNVDDVQAWLRSVAPQTVPARQAGPTSAVADPVLRGYLTNVLERISPLNTGLEAPSPETPAPTSTRPMYDEMPGMGRFRSRAAADPAAAQTFDQEFPLMPSGQSSASPANPTGSAKVAMTPGRRARGALPTAAAPEMQGALSAPGSAAPESAGGALSTPDPRRGLMEQYQAMLDKIPKEAQADLTPAQKSRLAMNFWMSMLANSSKPGAYALGALGESGLSTGREADALEQRNVARGQADINRQRDDAYRAIGMQDKDQDNQRSDARNAVLDRNEGARLDLLRKQVDQGKWKAMNSGKSGTIVLYDQETGTSKDTGIKIDRGDTRSAEERLIDRATHDPKFLETMLQLKGKSNDVTDTAQFRAAMDLLKGDMGGQMSPEAAVAKAQGVARALKGGGAAEGAMPAGLPQGSKLVGTSNGKRVFETTDGKRLIEK